MLILDSKSVFSQSLSGELARFRTLGMHIPSSPARAGDEQLTLYETMTIDEHVHQQQSKSMYVAVSTSTVIGEFGQRLTARNASSTKVVSNKNGGGCVVCPKRKRTLNVVSSPPPIFSEATLLPHVHALTLTSSDCLVPL